MNEGCQPPTYVVPMCQPDFRSRHCAALNMLASSLHCAKVPFGRAYTESGTVSSSSAPNCIVPVLHLLCVVGECCQPGANAHCARISRPVPPFDYTQCPSYADMPTCRHLDVMGLLSMLALQHCVVPLVPVVPACSGRGIVVPALQSCWYPPCYGRAVSMCATQTVMC